MAASAATISGSASIGSNEAHSSASRSASPQLRASRAARQFPLRNVALPDCQP